MFHAYILGMDAFALGLIKAVKIIEEGTVDKFIADRYSSFNDGIGRKIRSGEASLEELSDYACNMKKASASFLRQTGIFRVYCKITHYSVNRVNRYIGIDLGTSSVKLLLF